VTQVYSLDDISLQNTWLAIGVFDGVHRGHQEMLRQLRAGAQTESAPAVVLTFEPHPAVVLGHQADFKWLSPGDERTELLAAQGVEHIILQHFDQDFAAIRARDFMQSLSVRLGLRRLLVGYDFALGRNREGNLAFLTELGRELGYTVQPISPVSDTSGVISSTRIRQNIRNGEVSEAALGLGRDYFVRGEVVHGDGRGRTIQIPTANLELPPSKLIPANGVYACWAWIGGTRCPAVTNIGTRPTFTSGEQASHVETHLLDFQEEIYDQTIQLEFVSRLRTEQRFPSVEALVGQIHRDIEQAKNILK
jgi:riboflavin kinase/FMN adenylyltransferase